MLFINSHLQHKQTHHCTVSAGIASDPHYVWQYAYKTVFTLQQILRMCLCVMFLVCFLCFFCVWGGIL